MKPNAKPARTAQGSNNGDGSVVDNRRRRIVRAAKPVFLKYGYRRVTMNDLAQAAGISRAALYLVFPNKDNFFYEAIRELAREASEEVNRRLEPARSPIKKLKFVCDVWMVRRFGWLQTPEAMDIYSRKFAEEAVNEEMILFERDLAAIIELLPKGTLPKGMSHSHAAHLLAGAMTGIRRQCHRSEDLRKEIHALIDMVFRLI